jgi:transposase
LKSWGFTPQKPAFRAYEQSSGQVRQWLKQDYPAVKRRAQKQRGTVFWLDEVGMRSQHQAGTTYAPKGKTPVLPRTGQRFGLNLVSAITNRGEMVFVVVEGSFNGEAFIGFLQKLLRSVRQKVFLIADSHPVHVQKQVSAWLQEHQKKIEMILLPTYSPELNPDEYFNQDLKTNGVGKPRPKNKEELRTLAEKFANGKKRNPEKVKQYFHPRSVAYAR